MTSNDSSTIIALSTPRGYGAIALIRLSGSKALQITNRLFVSSQKPSPGKAVFGNIVDDSGIIDTGFVTYFKAPNSYTGEDIIEISIHGNPYLSDLVISAFKNLGAVSAGPGEFTQRAFLNGKMDLSQAEGVADIIYSSSRAAQAASAGLLKGILGKEIAKIKSDLIDILSVLELELDFQEEDIEFTPLNNVLRAVSTIIASIDGLLKTYKIGKIIREGLLCPIIGAPNSGKSCLFNAFLQEERVIVSSRPGTTRDYIEETIRIGNYQIRLVDTAGLRDTDDKIESMGMDKTKDLIQNGDVLLYVIDLLDPPEKISKMTRSLLKKTYFILNKNDVAGPAQIQKAVSLVGNRPYFVCSALNHSGVHEISTSIMDEIDKHSTPNSAVIITRERHKDALLRTNLSLKRSINSIRLGAAPEIITIDLREALEHLDVILGKTENDDILNNIFNNFCVGK